MRNVEIHQYLWVHLKRCLRVERHPLRDHVRVTEVLGLHVWRTLLPISYTGREELLQYVIVGVWTDADAWQRWSEELNGYDPVAAHMLRSW